MSVLLIIGVILVGLGLAGLGYCVVQARKLRGANDDPEARKAVLKRLIAVNMGSMALATLGLMCVVIGLFL